MKKSFVILFILLISSICHAQTSPINVVKNFALCMEKICATHDESYEFAIDSLLRDDGAHVIAVDEFTLAIARQKYSDINKHGYEFDTFMLLYIDEVNNNRILSVKYSDFNLCKLSKEIIKSKNRKFFKGDSFVTCSLIIKTPEGMKQYEEIFWVKNNRIFGITSPK